MFLLVNVFFSFYLHINDSLFPNQKEKSIIKIDVSDKKGDMFYDYTK